MLHPFRDKLIEENLEFACCQFRPSAQALMQLFQALLTRCHDTPRCPIRRKKRNDASRAPFIQSRKEKHLRLGFRATTSAVCTISCSLVVPSAKTCRWCWRTHLRWKHGDFGPRQMQSPVPLPQIHSHRHQSSLPSCDVSTMRRKLRVRNGWSATLLFRKLLKILHPSTPIQ